MTQMKNQTSKHNKCKCGQTKPAIWNTCAWCLHQDPMPKNKPQFIPIRKDHIMLATNALRCAISYAKYVKDACDGCYENEIARDVSNAEQAILILSTAAEYAPTKS